MQPAFGDCKSSFGRGIRRLNSARWRLNGVNERLDAARHDLDDVNERLEGAHERLGTGGVGALSRDLPGSARQEPRSPERDSAGVSFSRIGISCSCSCSAKRYSYSQPGERIRRPSVGELCGVGRPAHSAQELMGSNFQGDGFSGSFVLAIVLVLSEAVLVVVLAIRREDWETFGR